MSKACNFCGNQNFKAEQIQYIYRRNNLILIVNDVPCEKCEYCGEQYFRADVLKKIEKDFMDIYLNGKRSKQSIQVPVEDFAEL